MLNHIFLYFLTTYIKMPNHFLLHIGDGIHFTASSVKSIWGIKSQNTWAKAFISNAKEGDLLWFVKSKTNGQIVAVATFTQTKERILGPLIQLTLSDEELGWDKTKGNWDTEVHYKDLYNLTPCNLISEIKGAAGIRLYNDKCKVDLPSEYPNIVRYSKVLLKM
jgi:hypothetical protein